MQVRFIWSCHGCTVRTNFCRQYVIVKKGVQMIFYIMCLTFHVVLTLCQSMHIYTLQLITYRHCTVSSTRIVVLLVNTSLLCCTYTDGVRVRCESKHVQCSLFCRHLYLSVFLSSLLSSPCQSFLALPHGSEHSPLLPSRMSCYEESCLKVLTTVESWYDKRYNEAPGFLAHLFCPNITKGVEVFVEELLFGFFHLPFQ